MRLFCEKCGRRINDAVRCPFCGHIPMELQPSAQQNPPVPQQPPIQQPPVPVTPQPYPPAFRPPVTKLPKAKKKHKLPGIVRFLIVITVIAGVLFGSWYAFGNMLTLYIHSEDVVETLNSGSLELEGTRSAYDELPDYVKDMLGDDVQEDYGPITKAVLPYISVERVKIKGFFNASSVVYEISAPDLESWLLSLEDGAFTTEDELMELMTAYMETAPVRKVQVEINYQRDGLFSFTWQGNYYTREFSDAICGGLNSAYNLLYEQAMDEINEALTAQKEANE